MWTIYERLRNLLISAIAISSIFIPSEISKTEEKIEVISTEEFQKFIDGLSLPWFGIDALMNICKAIDISLMNGQTPYPRVFHK